MDKLIITVTCDSSMSFPHNPHNPTPRGIAAVADEYVRSVEAGASICHLHGPYTVDAQVQADGTRLSDLDIPGWLELRTRITDRCRPVIQYGIANGRFPQRQTLLRQQRPDMASVCFNAHDECFDYNPGAEPVELYGLHDREELRRYCELAAETGVKLEVESFHYGAIWNATRLLGKGLLKTPVWTTFFLGWRGGTWTPPTPKALIYMHDHCPPQFIYNVSVMDPEAHWPMITQAILLGGHVRVGMEDSPFTDAGRTFARSNAELVAKTVRLAREVGREVATPEETRRLLRIG